ncbi:hypothetical protein L1049_001441 [Liquidambar formosana]|uniref:ethanolamine-phosphate cytidylyltransferase n=1 Tax=Liquidambar formosana TaxID=63359 RepID=A0AAP0NBI1_LIQFO
MGVGSKHRARDSWYQSQPNPLSDVTPSAWAHEVLRAYMTREGYEILKSARQLGDFLLVGIHTDQTVSEHRGTHYPIMHLHERSLGVLACRYVDEVIIGAPWEVTNDMITTFNISLVVHGTVAESNSLLSGETDPYTVPKSMGIFQMLESPKSITTNSVAQRIIANHEAYLKRNAKKAVSEKKYYEHKKYVSGD